VVSSRVGDERQRLRPSNEQSATVDPRWIAATPLRRTHPRRLAIPRRVYTQSHIDYVIEVILEVWKRREQIRDLDLTYQAPFCDISRRALTC